MAVLLTFAMVIIVGALVLVGFFHYRKTGSLLPSLPKLPRSVSFIRRHVINLCMMNYIKEW